MMKKWERYLFFKILWMVCAILFGIFTIFILVDLSTHSVRFFGQGKAGILSVLFYYGNCLSTELNLFLSLAFLLAMLKVLLDLGQHGVLVALQMAGLSKRKIARPLLMIASICALISYANAQWFAPASFASIEAFRKESKKNKRVRKNIHTIILEDGSEIVYQKFDPSSNAIFDAYWIQPNNEFWHIKSLDIGSTPPVGRFADLFAKDASGHLFISQSFDLIPFPSLLLTPAAALQQFVPFENRSLWLLVRQSFSSSANTVLIRSHLYYKSTLPLLPFLLAFSFLPILMRFSRYRRAFFISSFGLFTLISFFTVMDGLLILAENGVFPPFVAICGPLICGLSGGLFYFWKNS